MTDCRLSLVMPLRCVAVLFSLAQIDGTLVHYIF